MSRTVSPASGKPYGLARVCRVWRASRATIYRHLLLPARTAPASWPGWADAGSGPGRRNPRGPDRQPLSRRGSPQSLGQAARRWPSYIETPGAAAHARARPPRAPRVGAPRGPRNHDGTIIPETVDTMWGTDLTTTFTGEGQVAVFVAVDHCSAECVGIHAARRATRFEAEPIRQGVRRCLGGFAQGIGRGLSVRHDHGSQYMSDAFQQELAFLGVVSSPAFVRAPEGNGCAERFIRTLKENLLWVRTFDTVEDLRQALLDFREICFASPRTPGSGLQPFGLCRFCRGSARAPPAVCSTASARNLHLMPRYEPFIRRQQPRRIGGLLGT